MSSSTTTRVKFLTESVAEQQNGTTYKRVRSSYFDEIQPNLVQCAFTCTDEGNCKSVYVDGGACVFGVDDVTMFEEGELVTPDPGQLLKIKGKKV